MKKKLDNKMWYLYGHCFDCQVKVENKLRINGTYDEWAKSKVKLNQKSYLTDMENSIKEWMEENEIAIEHGIKNEISESLISDLKVLFESHNIEIPEDSFDALEEANGKIEELTSKLNEQLEKNIELSKGNEDLECSEVFTKVCKDLTDTDTEKLRSLAEGLEFETVEQYNEKLNLLKDRMTFNNLN